jgi:hypothetical protein
MTLMSLARLPISAEEGWPALARLNPGILKVFFLLVLPLSLLPPLMLYYVGRHYPEIFGQVAPQRNFAVVATVFFLAEMATFLVMGWLIKQVGQTYSLNIDYHDAYLLAAIAPVPLWLSSLGLFVPQLLFNAAVSLVALGLSCALLYHGLQALGHKRDAVVATGIVQIVIGAGLIAWALLLVLAFL